VSRAGRSRTGGTGRRRRPAEMRRRADEMAALLDEAAPRAARGRRRRATAVPAAVAAFGALSIGGVGLALGLTPTGTEGILPASPAPALADPTATLPTTSDGAAGTTAATGSVADPAIAGADLIRTGDHRASADAAPAPVGHQAGAPTTRAPRPASARPTPTTTRARTTASRPTPTTARSATPRSTSTRPATTRTAVAPRPAAQRSSLPTTAADHRSPTSPEPQEPAAASTDAPSTPDEDTRE
jgi:hypothetical protein